MAACLNLPVRKLFVIVIRILGFNVSMSSFVGRWKATQGLELVFLSSAGHRNVKENGLSCFNVSMSAKWRTMESYIQESS